MHDPTPRAPLRLTRRTVLARASGALAASVLGNRSIALAATTLPHPILATPEQVAAEALLLELLRDPELPALQAELKAEIMATPQARVPDAARTLDRAIAQWTNSLMLKEIALHRASPAILYGTDDTPRTWLGHTIAVGTSGDNPDKIYRIGYCDGEGAYEIIGQWEQGRRPAQIILDVGRSGPVPVKSEARKAASYDILATLVDDRNLVVEPGGRFRITMGGKADGPNHIALTPGLISFGFREVISDWATQRPARMVINRLDGAPPKPFDKGELRRRIFADLPPYIRFWSAFPTTWMGGLAPNAFSQPMGRVGGWGFVAGLRFQLKPGEALLFTTGRNGAKYTGIQINDPWMIQPDVREHLASLNVSQVTANPDGTVTYVIAPEDPGVANWLDTAGLHEGIGIMRWQVTPIDATGEGLIREHRVVTGAEVSAMRDLPRVTPAERRAQLTARRSYDNRLL